VAHDRRPDELVSRARAEVTKAVAAGAATGVEEGEVVVPVIQDLLADAPVGAIDDVAPDLARVTKAPPRPRMTADKVAADPRK
jgi:hypothetical protein